MPNIASVLREEILRLSRKEVRNQTTTTKKASAQQRRDIAALKRQIVVLKRQVQALSRVAARTNSAGAATVDGGAVKLRFVAKGLRAHRERLGLSAGDFGRLIGVSAQSVYAWEARKSTPRREQLAKIAAVRKMGKREVVARLGSAGSATKTPRKRTRRATTKKA